jgi:hypothetical protein
VLHHPWSSRQIPSRREGRCIHGGSLQCPWDTREDWHQFPWGNRWIPSRLKEAKVSKWPNRVRDGLGVLTLGGCDFCGKGRGDNGQSSNGGSGELHVDGCDEFGCCWYVFVLFLDRWSY